MVMMMMIKNPENPGMQSISNDPITISSCPTWKLYENPFYTQNFQKKKQQQKQSQSQIHHLHLPISARKIAASFWDLTFVRPLIMESELDKARNKITELKAELEKERKGRKKVESTNKKLGRELSEERKGREALERLCEELAKEISSEKAQINRMKKEMEEERKMLRVAEVLREERVQMKLADAKFLLEEKLLELETVKRKQTGSVTFSSEEREEEEEGGSRAPVVAEKSGGNIYIPTQNQRKGSPEPEPENHHIKRGIKGFVEFPKVVRAIGSKSKHLGTKLECQKAQLRILLKQKTSLIRSNSLLTN